MTDDEKRKGKFRKIILAYPVALVLIGLILNLLILGVQPAVVALPSVPIMVGLVTSAVLLVINHTWLMTSTELTRLKYNMHATPEEWQASGRAPSDASELGLRELNRHHNAHGNATENVVYFVFLAMLVSLVSPEPLTAQVWMIGFAAGRLGHMLSYLTGRDGARGICMSISLASLYGLASYLIISLII